MGGRVNDKGEIEWDANVPFDEQIAYYSSKPPASFSHLRLTPIPMPDHPFDGHGEPVNSVFEIACTCGGQEFIASAHEGEGGWSTDPLSIRCNACGLEQVVFNYCLHGYDGALGHYGEPKPPTTSRIVLTGEDIGQPPYRIAVRFEYPSDILGDDGFKDWKGREGELYSWFT
jgi:hypothetical protein